MRWPLISFSFDFLRLNLKFYWVWHRPAFINSVCIYTLRTAQSGGALQGGPIKHNHYEQLNKDFTLVSDFMLNQTASALTVKHTGVFGLVGERSFLSRAFLSFVLWDTEELPLCVSVCLSTGGLFPGDSHEYEVFRFALAQNQDIPKLVPQVDMVDTSSSFAMTYACKFIDRWRSGAGQRVTLCWCLGYFTTFLTELFNSGISSILCTCASAVSFHGAFLLGLISFYKAVQVPCSSFRYLNWYEWMQAGGPGA